MREKLPDNGFLYFAAGALIVAAVTLAIMWMRTQTPSEPLPETQGQSGSSRPS